MSGLVLEMQRFVVGRPGLPHFPQDLEPALPQAAECAGMAFAERLMVLVIGLRPWASH